MTKLPGHPSEAVARVSKARENPTDLVFVASRVSRLDDEHGHLRG